MLDPPPDNNFWLALSVSVITNLIQVSVLLFEPHTAYCNSRPFFITRPQQSFALAIQRKSHILNDTIFPIEHRKNAFRRPLWVAGFSSYLIANIIGSIFTIGYLPIVILAPIGAMGLVFNAIFAKLVLGDPFTRKSVIGIYFILFPSTLSSQVSSRGMPLLSSYKLTLSMAHVMAHVRLHSLTIRFTHFGTLFVYVS